MKPSVTHKPLGSARWWLAVRAAVLVTGLHVPFASGVGHAATPQEILDEAVSEYRAALDCADRDERLQRFHRAELLFRQLLEPQRENGVPRNADLYVNLGNAALGAERLGPAILAYRRALLMDPDHHRALQNLRHARTLLPESVPRPAEGGFLDTFFSWAVRLSHAERRNAAAVTFLATAVLLAIAIRWRQNAYRNIAILPALAWVFFAITLVLDARRDQSQDAVIIVPEIVARSADSANAPARFSQPLVSGAEVRILESRETWCHVQLANGRDAWLPSTSLETVSDG
jgi:tetratricopeptide (TPR) repeat protein